MKTNRILPFFILVLLLFSVLDGFTQTKVVSVPIISDDAYTIETYAYNEETKTRSWLDIRETQIEYNSGWYATGEMNLFVAQYYVEYFRFKTGSEERNCAEYTYLKVCGSPDKEVIKDKPDFRVRFVLDGGSYVYGTEIGEPE